MPIPAACPACRTPIELPDDQSGRSFSCPRCSALLVSAAGGQLVVQSRMFAGQTANPFAEDPATGYYAAGYGPPGFGPGYRPFPVLTREMVLAKVRGPALLQITGGLIILTGLLLPLTLLSENVQDDEAAFYILSAIAVVCLAAGGLVLWCGLRMQMLRSYSLVLGTIILMMVTGFLVCPLLALPGVWPFIVLLDPGVRANFGAAPAITER
jgi:hypothetical protein